MRSCVQRVRRLLVNHPLLSSQDSVECHFAGTNGSGMLRYHQFHGCTACFVVCALSVRSEGVCDDAAIAQQNEPMHRSGDIYVGRMCMWLFAYRADNFAQQHHKISSQNTWPRGLERSTPARRRGQKKRKTLQPTMHIAARQPQAPLTAASSERQESKTTKGSKTT